MVMVDFLDYIYKPMTVKESICLQKIQEGIAKRSQVPPNLHNLNINTRKKAIPSKHLYYFSSNWC